MLYLLALDLIFGFAVAQNTTPSDCGSCTVHGYPAGLLWAGMYEFLNETVYLEVDRANNNTRTITTEANSAAASSFSALCTAALETIKDNWGLPDGTGIDPCFSNRIVTQTFLPGSPEEFEAERIYPSTYIMFQSLDIVISSLATVSGKESCQVSFSMITSRIDYILTGEDTSVLSTFTNQGHIITWEGMPSGLLSAVPGLGKCTPGPGQGVPVTKIPIMGTASTVYQYKSDAEPDPSRSPTPEPGSTQGSVVSPTESAHPTETSGVNPLPHSASNEVKPTVQTTIMNSDTTEKEPPALTAPAIVIGTETIIVVPTLPGSALPEGYSLLPSGSGVVLPNGDTLLPGTVTTLDGVPVSVAPSGIGEPAGNSSVVQSPTSSVTGNPESAAEGKRMKYRVIASLVGVGFTIILLI